MSIAINTQIDFNYKGENINWSLTIEKENLTDFTSHFVVNCGHQTFKNRFYNTSISCHSLRELLMNVNMSDKDYLFFYMMERSVVNSLSTSNNIHNNTYHIESATHQTVYRQAC
ncbi:MAG: hypothetical protein H7101_08070 [Deinococcales bacterium]|nr:hypothetical protein [Chitinophagaceae bacterium]